MRRGYGRFFRDQTYHHQVLRALHHGGELSEVLEATRHIRAGDPEGWFAAFTALGDRNMARAAATRDRISRGYALLRAHVYYLRAEFFLPPQHAERARSFAKGKAAFYEGLDTLGVEYERIGLPSVNAVYYPGTRGPLLVFCGGSDSTLEELYFFLVPAARARGYGVLCYEGPGQGSILREHGTPMTHEWEKPTSALLDAFLAGRARPDNIVLIGLSLGGYLAPRAAAFDDRVDGVVSYDVFFDGGAVAARIVPGIARVMRRFGLEGLVDVLAPIRARFDPAAAFGLHIGGWILGKARPFEIAEALSRYTLEPVADRIRQDVLLFAGEEDQFVPVDQTARYQHALVNAKSVTTRVYDAASGGAEHSQLGAASLWQADLFDWLEEKFEAARADLDASAAPGGPAAGSGHPDGFPT